MAGNNTTSPIVCWEDWQAESEFTWTPIIFAAAMCSITLAANLTVILTIFTTEKLRNQVT